MSKPKLIGQPVAKTLYKMAFPMLAGSFAMTAFNLTDTWFVSKLGTLPLAAMGFSFPVVMVLMSITMGLGIGASAVIANTLGRNDLVEARKITTHTLILSMLIVTFVSIAGLVTIEPLFKLLGASPKVIPLIKDYMTIWYLGVVFIVFPMMANNIMRSTGDTVIPSLVMIISSVINIILDPIMIFGFLGVPGMGIKGAALATLISRACSCVASIWFLHKKHRLINFEIPKLKSMLKSWNEVLQIGLPSCLSSVLLPVSSAVIMYFVSRHGIAAVAACSAAARLERFAFMVPMSLGSSLVPFVGQNFGAGLIDRIRQGHRYANGFAFVFGIAIAGFFAYFAGNMASFFSKDPEVLIILKQYLLIIPMGYGMMEINRYAGFFFNGLKLPLHSTALNIYRVFVLLIPMTWAGNAWFGLSGIFYARLTTDTISGITGFTWSHNRLKKISNTNK